MTIYKSLLGIIGIAVFTSQVFAMDIQTKSDQYFDTYKVPSIGTVRMMLSDKQFDSTQNHATDPAYMKQRSYLNNKQQGIYVDILSGEPLFSSLDKYDSGTGWPAFTKPINNTSVVTSEDDSLGIVRTEVSSSASNSHLGHIFNDGPAPAGLRYCINSSSLRFISTKYMKALGYGEYMYLFN